ncbi:MAG: hypothetical protein DRN71_01445 [Candidatus Nanohalarchaeota archaeon]|nr:MAG: hypothetical protein DRN71_01445 [Candidatus Nanohaloarchaeota archaeon]
MRIVQDEHNLSRECSMMTEYSTKKYPTIAACGLDCPYTQLIVALTTAAFRLENVWCINIYS